MRDNAPWLVAITRNRRVENESLQDFIEKKRNMFVLQVRENGGPHWIQWLFFQYELTVKRTEMRKLEEITAAEEQRIEKAEKDLEEDAVRKTTPRVNRSMDSFLAYVRSILGSEQ